MSELLVLDGLGKDFGTKRAVEALTCTVDRGDLVGLLGPNGAGKTTTMRLLLGLLRPTRGRATFDGLDCTRDALTTKQRIGYSPDEPAFYDYLTGRETIEFALNVRNMDAASAWPRVKGLAEVLEYSEFLGAAVGSHSHGTKKKLALLLALVHEPKLLLLDEPTNGLDPPTAARIKDLLRQKAQEGVAVVISTHHLDLADRLCRRMLILHEGKLLVEGSPEDIRRHAGVEPAATLEAAFLRMITAR